jgi:hypothetical protein
MAQRRRCSRTKNLLKGELKRRGVSYRELMDELAAIGISETERNIANKISRGASWLHS